MDKAQELLQSADRALREGNLSQASALCKEALKRDNRNIQARMMLAACLGSTGEWARAIALTEEIAAEAPDFAQAHLLLTTLLRRTGRIREAAEVADRFLERVPEYAPMYGVAGGCHLLQDRYSEAAECFRRGLAVQPDLPILRQGLAEALDKLGKKSEAVKVRQSLAGILDPLSEKVRTGNALIAEGKINEGLLMFERAASDSPDSFEAQYALGNALKTAGKVSDAGLAFRKAVEIKPSNAAGHTALGNVLQEMGQFEEAARCFEKALALQPGRVSLYLNIVTSRRILDIDRPIIQVMENLLENEEMSYSDRSLLHYALGKAYDDLGDYEKAMSHADMATEIGRKHPSEGRPPFDRTASDATVDFAIRTFTPTFFEKHKRLGLESDLPVFIVGAPRSGTTLLDQILSCHPDVGGAGELLYWIENSAQALEAILEGGAERDIARRYLSLLRELCPGKRRVVDKMPMNYGALGRIRVLLPNARIVHCRRNPVDTCISLYLNGHTIEPKPYGDTREEMVAGYKNYVRTMDHWRKVLPPDRFIEVDYEEVVADREAVLGRLLPFLGLEWSDACLHHEANTRVVSTPSKWQVRQPIYKSSVARWKRYEPWLGAFRQLLPDVSSTSR